MRVAVGHLGERALERLRSQPRAVVALVGILAAGYRLALLLSVAPQRRPQNFDEGAYFSAAALLVRGHVMYRDYVAVHPPGLFYLLAPFAALGRPSTALVAARCAMCLLGGVNTWLVGRIALRHVSLGAAVCGAVASALASEVVLADTSVVIEPVLSCMALAVAWVWLREVEPDAFARRAWQAGLVLGLAGSCKAWAVLLIVPMAVTAPAGRRVRDLARVAGGSLAAFAAVTGPVIALAPSDFFAQVVRFQVLRPGDGTGVLSKVRLERLLPSPTHLDYAPNVAFLAIGLVVVCSLVAVRGPRLGRFGAYSLTWACTLAAAICLASVHAYQYNALLGPPAALTLAMAVQRWRDREPAHSQVMRWAGVALAMVLVAAGVHAVRLGIHQGTEETGDVEAIASQVRGFDSCAFSFEAGWLLAGDRIPNDREVGPLATDAYVGGLLAAVDAGEGSQQFDSAAAQRTIRAAVLRCPIVVLGPRGRWHLGSQLEWFERTFRRVGHTGPDGPDVWVRRG